MATATITTGHPLKWGQGMSELHEINVHYTFERCPDMPGRYNVLVSGERVGWVTRSDNEWSACLPPQDGRFQGKIVATGCSTRSSAVDELIWEASRSSSTGVAETVAALWEAAAGV